MQRDLLLCVVYHTLCDLLYLLHIKSEKDVPPPPGMGVSPSNMCMCVRACVFYVFIYINEGGLSLAVWQIIKLIFALYFMCCYFFCTLSFFGGGWTRTPIGRPCSPPSFPIRRQPAATLRPSAHASYHPRRLVALVARARAHRCPAVEGGARAFSTGSRVCSRDEYLAAGIASVGSVDRF